MLSASLNKTFPSFLQNHLTFHIHAFRTYIFVQIIITAATTTTTSTTTTTTTTTISTTTTRNGMEMFYLTTHSTHFIYGYMASDIW